MKYVFLIVLSACIILFARSKILVYKRFIKNGEEFLNFLSFAGSQITYSDYTIYEIVKRFNRLNNNSLFFLSEAREPVFKSVESKLKNSDALTKKQIELINAFFVYFGKSGEREQLNHIANYERMFLEENMRIKEEYKDKHRLITRLSLLLSAAVFVILM